MCGRLDGVGFIVVVVLVLLLEGVVVVGIGLEVVVVVFIEVEVVVEEEIVVEVVVVVAIEGDSEVDEDEELWKGWRSFGSTVRLSERVAHRLVAPVVVVTKLVVIFVENETQSVDQARCLKV